MEIATLVLNVLRRLLQQAGPYLAIEIILPGGTLIALALYVYRNRKTFFSRPCRSAVLPIDYRT
jgi:hypothetical protein